MPNIDELDRLEKAATDDCFPTPWRVEELEIYARDGAHIGCCLESEEIAAFIVAARNQLRPLLTLLADMGGGAGAIGSM